MTFEPDGHRYLLAGVEVPSVTTVLHACAMLPNYAAFDPFYRERGSALHEAVKLDFLGDLDDESLDDEVRPYLERQRRWAVEVDFRPVMVEEPLACPVYRYAGTPDAIGESNLGLIIPDWKAGQFEPGHRVQVAGGYVPLLERAAEDGLLPLSVKDVRKARPCVVPLTNDLPKPVWIDPGNERNLFRAALAVYAWRRANMRRGNERRNDQ